MNEVILSHQDILFGLVREFVLNRRKEPGEPAGPKIIVMSATLHAEKFSAFFNCSTYVIPGKLFPVEVFHGNAITPANYQGTSFCSKAIDVVMEIHENKPAGIQCPFPFGSSTWYMFILDFLTHCRGYSCLPYRKR